MELGERIAVMREEQALTQAELAEAARISPSTLSQIESGRVPRPHVGTVRKIARALGVEPAELHREKELTGAGKIEAPREAGPALLNKVIDAVLQNEARSQKTFNRTLASEGAFQHMTDFAEDKVRAELREIGFPDEYFESLFWPLAVGAAQVPRLEQENARLKEEVARLREEAGQESVHR